MCVGVPVWVDILHSQTGGGYAISVKLWQSPCGHREEQLWKWKQTIGSRTKRKTDRTQNTMIAPEVLDTAIPKRIHSHNFLVLGANKLLSWLSWLWLGFLSTCKKKTKKMTYLVEIRLGGKTLKEPPPPPPSNPTGIQPTKNILAIASVELHGSWCPEFRRDLVDKASF